MKTINLLYLDLVKKRKVKLTKKLQDLESNKSVFEI